MQLTPGRFVRVTSSFFAILLLAGAVPADGRDLSRPVPAGEPELRRESELGSRPIGSSGGSELRYRVTASAARVNRRLMGPLRRTVQGVPAEPVDSFVWDGNGSTPIEGQVSIDVLPMRNTGIIEATWTDQHGDWTFTMTRFLHPDEHSSGVRIGSTVYGTDTVLNEAISHNVYLHGDTTAGQPVLPTVFTFLAAWGPAKVTLNGELFENPFEIPAPRWGSHIMVTEGVRRPDGTVRTLTNEIYNPTRASDGAVESGDLELHITFHDEAFPRTSSLPDIFSFFYHLVFEDVQIEILQADIENETRTGDEAAAPAFR